MYTVRCTHKVLEALDLPPVDGSPAPSTALGDWYVNFIHTRKHRLVHFLSDRSLLSVVVPVKPLKTAFERHVISLGELLGELGVKQPIVDAELGEMHNREVRKTCSQSVLASMRDLALNARWILEQMPSIGLLELSLELGHVPCGPLGMSVPAEVAIGLLNHRYSSLVEGEGGA